MPNLQVYVNEEVYDSLGELAKVEGKSRTALAAQYIEAGIERNTPKTERTERS